MYIMKGWYYGMNAPPVNWQVLAVCICNEHIYALVSLRYRSYSTVCMGLNACVDELPPHVYHGYHRYVYRDGCLNGTTMRIIGYRMNRYTAKTKLLK